MHYLHLLLVCLFSFTSLSAEQAILPYITSENDALSLVEEIVDAYNGKLVQKDLDIQVLGSDPLELNRYYDGGHHFESEIGYGVGLSCPLLLSLDFQRDKQNLRVEQRAGFEVACTVYPMKTDKKGKRYYKGDIDPELFKYGYTNCCEALLSGKPSLLALQAEGDDRSFVVSLGDGTKRHYAFFGWAYATGLYRLVREDCANGNHRHYSYVDSDTLYLKRIWTTNPSQSLTLNWVNFSYGGDDVQLQASNGQSVSYHQKVKTGKAKNRTLTSYSSVKFSQSVLERVTGSHLPTSEYEALSRSHYLSTLFSTKEIRRPEGRSLKVTYDDHERVKQLWQSGLDVPLYSFDYRPNLTIVTGANGAVQQFHYKQRRLVKRVDIDRIHRFEWDTKGQLVKQVLADSQDRPVIQREYSYDNRGNILQIKVSGTICAQGSHDTYVIQYRYSDEGRNSLIQEDHSEGLSIRYTYAPNSNLLTSKLTVWNQQVVEREFCRYDENGILVETIQDDGLGETAADLNNVTYRKITESTPQLDPNQPGITLPKIVQESCLDPQSGTKTVLKRIEKVYDKDLLVEEKVFDAEGVYCYSHHYVYNTRRQLLSETDSMGVKTLCRYNDNGEKIFEEKNGRQLEWSYDSAGNLKKESEQADQKVLVTAHDYDAVGNCTRTVDPFGQVSTFEYDLGCREKAATDPLGYTIRKEYDTQGNISSHTDQEGYATQTAYNLYGKPLEIQYPDGTTKRFTYNLQGHLVRTIERDGLRTEDEVDYKGRATSTKVYDSEGTLLKTTQKSYKGSLLLSETDAKGFSTCFTYDAAERVIAKSQGEKLTRYVYDSLGRLTKTIASFRVEVQNYDHLDRVVEKRTEDVEGNLYRKVGYSYDGNGNCVSERVFLDADQISETKTEYNARSLPIALTDACGNRTTFSYAYSDHLEKETFDALGRKTKEIYDPLKRLECTVRYDCKGTLLSESSLRYDGRGNLNLQTEAMIYNGQPIGSYTMATAYDSMSQKISETEQNQKTTQYAYHLGRLHQIVNPDGVILTHGYDALGHLQSLISSDGTIDYHYGYDLNDNLERAENRVNQTVTKRAYDAHNRHIHETQATGQEVAYVYDALDRLQEISFGDRRITYAYDPASLRSASYYRSNELKGEYRQTTDWRGKVLSCEGPHNLSIAYSRDAIGRCTVIETSAYQQGAIYDAVGNLSHLSVQDPIGVYQADYFYDSLDQLLEETGPFANQYHFDSLNNRRAKNGCEQTISALNQVVSASLDHYTHDLNGRRTGKGDDSYVYDALGRLIKCKRASGSVHYQYDPFGRLVEQVSERNKTEYLYQFDTQIASLEKGQVTELKAIYGEQAPFAIEVQDKLYGVIQNPRGDIMALLEGENVAATYRYDAFGKFVHEGGVDSPWLFSGQRFDTHSGTYQFTKRAYDPNLGVWLTPDPAGFADGLNLYAYVNNNPLIYVDAYGLWKEECEALDRSFREFSRGLTRGFFDDASFGATDYVLGEHRHSSLANRMGYYAGTGGSLAAGCLYGSTWIRGGTAAIKGSMTAFRALSSSLNFTRGTKALNHARQIQLASATELGAQVRQAISHATHKNFQIAENRVRKEAVKKVFITNTDTVHVTTQGVAIPSYTKYRIPSHYVENVNRSGSYGEYVNGKFIEKLRIDPATSPGMKGPNYSHYHLNGKSTHYSPRPGTRDPGFNP